jgi:hypothetical protein
MQMAVVVDAVYVGLGRCAAQRAFTDDFALAAEVHHEALVECI